MTISIEKVTDAELHQIINKYEKGQCAVIAPKTDYRMAKELLAAREAQSVPVKFAGWGLYHAERDEFGGWLKSTPETDKSHAITKHGYVNVKLYTAPPALPANVIGRPATPDDSPYPATISGGCLLAQAWADGYNVRNAVTAAPESLDDTRRMDWLVAHHVEVRKPLLYGSEKFFTAQTLTDKEDDYHATSLREQIDAAMAAPTPTNQGADGND